MTFAPTAAAAPVVATTTPATSGVAIHTHVATHLAPVRQVAASTTPNRSHAKSATYTVQRRDTLWSIAATQLGDPLRWPELAHLNPGVVGPAPDFLIRTGATLTLGGPGPDEEVWSRSYDAGVQVGQLGPAQGVAQLGRCDAPEGVSPLDRVRRALCVRPVRGGARGDLADRGEMGRDVGVD